MWGLISSLLWASTVVVQPASLACPSEQAITAELDHLGVLSALTELGASEVAVEGSRMRVIFFGRDGSVLGVREFAVPDSCSERAFTAATFIAAWVGAWSVPLPVSGAEATPSTILAGGARDGESRALPAPTNASHSPVAPPDPLPPPLLPSAAPSPSGSSVIGERARPSTGGLRGPRVELGIWVLGTHDGDASAMGGGLLAQYRLANHVAMAALIETTSERELPVGPAVAAYRRSRMGLGASVARRWGPLFLEAGIFPELTLLIVHGKQLAVGNTVTTFGADMDLRMRLGLSTGRIVPFIFLGGAGALRAQHLTLEGNSASRSLSRWSANAGLGLAFRFGGNE